MRTSNYNKVLLPWLIISKAQRWYSYVISMIWLLENVALWRVINKRRNWKIWNNNRMPPCLKMEVYTRETFQTSFVGSQVPAASKSSNHKERFVPTIWVQFALGIILYTIWEDYYGKISFFIILNREINPAIPDF